jgi:Cys-rich protein (TIGR01571 family)
MNSSDIRPWPTSLTDCCASPGGLPRCCLACWCPCFSYAELLKEPELKGYCCHGDRISACVSYALLQALGFFPAAALHAGARSALRTERQYSGSLAEDFCATACCGSCALVQELNAADSRQQTQMTQVPPGAMTMTGNADGRSTGTHGPRAPLPVRMTSLGHARACSVGGGRPESRVRQTAAGRAESSLGGERFYVASALGDGAHGGHVAHANVSLSAPAPQCQASVVRDGPLLL